MSDNNLKDRAIEGSAANSLRGLIQSGLGMAAFLVFARYLKPTAFGTFALAAAFVAFGRTVYDLGFHHAIIQREKLDLTHRDTAFWSTLLIGTFLAGLLILLRNPVATWFGEPQLAPVLVVLSSGLVMGGVYRIPHALLVRDMDFPYLSLVSIVSTALGAAVGCWLAVTGRGIWSLVWYEVVTWGVNGLGIWWGVRWRPGLDVRWNAAVDLFPFGTNVVGKRLLQRVGDRLDDLLIGTFLGTQALGFYSVAYRILNLLENLLAKTLSHVAYPVFSRLQNQRDRLRRALLSALRLNCYLAFPAFLGLAAVAPAATVGVLGAQWEPAVILVQLLAIAGLLRTLRAYHTPLMDGLGKPSRDLLLTGANTVFLVVFFLIAVQFNVVVVAAAYLAATACTIGVAYELVRRRLDLGLTDYFPGLSPALVVAFVAAGLAYAVGFTPLARLPDVVLLGLQVSVGVVGWLAVAWGLHREQFYEILNLLARLLPWWVSDRPVLDPGEE